MKKYPADGLSPGHGKGVQTKIKATQTEEKSPKRAADSIRRVLSPEKDMVAQLDEKRNDDSTFIREYIQEDQLCINKKADESRHDTNTGLKIKSRPKIKSEMNIKSKVTEVRCSEMNIRGEKLLSVMKKVMSKAPLKETKRSCEKLVVHMETSAAVTTIHESNIKQHMIDSLHAQQSALTVAKLSESAEVFSSCTLKIQLSEFCTSSIHSYNHEQYDMRRCQGSPVMLALFNITRHLVVLLCNASTFLLLNQTSMMKSSEVAQFYSDNSKVIRYINNKRMLHLSIFLQQMDDELMNSERLFVNAWYRFLPLRSSEDKSKLRFQELDIAGVQAQYILTREFLLWSFVLLTMLAVSGGYVGSQKNERNSELTNFVDQVCKKINCKDLSVIADCLQFSACDPHGIKLLTALISRYNKTYNRVHIKDIEETTLRKMLSREAFICTEEIPEECEIHLLHQLGEHECTYDEYITNLSDTPIPMQVTQYETERYEINASCIPTMVEVTTQSIDTGNYVSVSGDVILRQGGIGSVQSLDGPPEDDD